MIKRIPGNLVALGLLASICLCCEPKPDLVRHFVIKKDNHYASPKLTESLQNQALSFEARFDESSRYDFGDLALQSNKNKLMGFSDCNSLHHENSARFAWQWFNDQLEIYAYCYVNGERKEAFLGVVEINVYNRYRVEIMQDSYVFWLNDREPLSIDRGSACDTGLYYKLWPYFGGEVPAPHEIRIDIKMSY